jgi:hypothetical protein
MARTVKMMKIAFPTKRLITVSPSYELYRHAGRETLEGFGSRSEPRGIRKKIIDIEQV